MRESFVAQYEGKQPGWGFNGLGYVVYKRTYSRPLEGRSEEWHETIRRVIDGAMDIGAGLTREEAERLYDYFWSLKALPAGRMLWQMGTDNIKRLGGDSLVNCWHVTIRDVKDFAFLFNELMLGGGVGFTISPEGIDRLPSVLQGKVTHLEGAHDADFIVPDKREGWADLLVRVLDAYFTGSEFSYSTVLIRPEGAPIKTFGGIASGPGILVEGVDHIIEILEKRVGGWLTTVDILDICNIIGSIVVSGNVRRSAQIAIAPPEKEYLMAKRWDLDSSIPPWRAMSNNTVFTDDPTTLPPEFWEGYEGNGEPYGLFNLEAARRYGRAGELMPDTSITGVNPCGEIPLGDHESCNLSEVYLPRVESEEELQDIVVLLYKVQKAVAALPYLDWETEQIVHRNMRLGMSMSGLFQASEEQLSWLSPAYESLRKADEEWSDQRQWPTSVRLTTVQPSGTKSLLAGTTPGIHPGYARFFVRRIRMAYNDSLVPWCREQGYPIEYVRDFEGNEDHRTVVVSFPCEFDSETTLAEDVSAIDQLEFAARLQREWADNAISVTVYYKLEELEEIQKWLVANWETTKSVSFLLHSDHGFDQAPYEEISEWEYKDMLATVSKRHVSFHAKGISSEVLSDDACATGACPVR